MKYKLTYYEPWCREIATIYLPTKQALAEFIMEKGHDQIMSWTKIDNLPEPYQFGEEA